MSNNSAITLCIEDQAEHTVGEMVAIGAIVCAAILLIIAGNVVVIVLFALDRRLKQTRHWLLVSLAVSDLIVATIVMPFWLVNELQSSWFSWASCDLLLSIDVIACTASIYNLCAIACDRYWSVTDVTYVRLKSRGRVKLMLAAVWVGAVVVGLPPLVGWKKGQDWAQEGKQVCEMRSLPDYVFTSVALSFWLPLFLMAAVYVVVIRETRKRFAASAERRRKMKELSKLFQRSCAPPNTPDTRKARRKTEGHIPSSHLPRTRTIGCMVDVCGRTTAQVSTINQGIPEKPCPPTHNMSDSPSYDIDSVDQECESDSKSQVGLKTQPALLLEKTPVHENPKVSQHAHQKTCNSGSKTGKNLLARLEDKQRSISNVLKNNPRRLDTGRNSIRREVRFNATISVVMGAFVICWLPFFVVYPMSVMMQPAVHVPCVLFKICVWLGYCNSCLNPIIYAALNDDIREAFWAVTRRGKCIVSSS